MLTLLAAILIQTPQPIEILKSIRDDYQKLASFSMDIEHHNSSGLFPGSYKQALSWRGGRFELKVTKPTDYKPTDQHPGGAAPNYACDGKYVSSGPGVSRELNTDPNSTPGWEVSGGFILGWLMKTPTSNFLFEPPKSFKIDYSFGPATKWKEMDVKEIVLSLDSQGRQAGLSIFASADLKTIVGFESKDKQNVGWVTYATNAATPTSPRHWAP